jgi:hypothetical protein
MSELSKKIKHADEAQRKQMLKCIKICCFGMVANGDVNSAEKMEAFFEEARALVMSEFDTFYQYYEEHTDYPPGVFA